MNTYRIWSVIILIITVLASWFIFSAKENPQYPFKLGLDLVGGSHLVYEADISELDPSEVPESMLSLIHI